MALFGILNVNKPTGLTSRDVVDHVERLIRPVKAGHAGTLDPLAKGVLVICVGQATRLIRYVQRMRKRYRATFQLGRRSNTDDTEGDIIVLESAVEPTRTAIDRVLPQFVGDIRQRPPAHSAIKVAGRRAYQLARKGTEFELPPRTVTIHEMKVRRYEYPELELDIDCGSGTYVRALGRDIGIALDTAAVMSALERSAIGTFCVEQSISLDDLNPLTLPQHLQPALVALAGLPLIKLTEAQVAEIHFGRPIEKPPGDGSDPLHAESSEWAAVNSAGQLVAVLGEKHPNQLWPNKNFA